MYSEGRKKNTEIKLPKPFFTKRNQSYHINREQLF